MQRPAARSVSADAKLVARGHPNKVVIIARMRRPLGILPAIVRTASPWKAACAERPSLTAGGRLSARPRANLYPIAIPPAHRQQALREGAFRPDMRRSDITLLKRTLLPPKPGKRRTRRAIEAELRRLDEEAARIARRRAELERELKTLST